MLEYKKDARPKQKHKFIFNFISKIVVSTYLSLSKVLSENKSEFLKSKSNSHCLKCLIKSGKVPSKTVQYATLGIFIVLPVRE